MKSTQLTALAVALVALSVFSIGEPAQADYPWQDDPGQGGGDDIESVVVPDSSDTSLDSQLIDLAALSVTVSTMDEAGSRYEYYVRYGIDGAYSSDVNRDDRDNH